MASLDAYTGRAEDYEAFRPGYYPDAFAVLEALVGLHPSWTVADIGSGTGNVLEHLLDRVHAVYAIEPNAAMRAVAQRKHAAHPSFRSVNAPAEATGLPGRSVDLIVVGQALHWFDPLAARREFSRILRPPGRLAVLWNQFGQSPAPDTDGWFAAGTQHHRRFPMCIAETWEQYFGGVRSGAGTPLPGDLRYEAFEEHQRSAFERKARDGMLKVEYTTELTVGQLPHPSGP